MPKPKETTFEEECEQAIENLRNTPGGIGWEIDMFETLLSKYKALQNEAMEERMGEDL